MLGDICLGSLPQPSLVKSVQSVSYLELNSKYRNGRDQSAPVSSGDHRVHESESSELVRAIDCI